MKNELLKGLVRTVLFIWELPQLVVGFIYTALLRSKVSFMVTYKDALVVFTDAMPTGISLGHFILLNTRYEKAADNLEKSVDVNHEYGHTIQSKILGPLYLIVIGIPSLTGNIVDRIFHKNWSATKRTLWYYNLPWEKWADKKGKVVRMVRSNGTIYPYVSK